MRECGLTEQIADARKVFPALRLGQLLMNALPQGRALFYVTDDELRQYLEDFVLEHGPKYKHGTATGSDSSRDPQ